VILHGRLNFLYFSSAPKKNKKTNKCKGGVSFGHAVLISNKRAGNTRTERENPTKFICMGLEMTENGRGWYRLTYFSRLVLQFGLRPFRINKWEVWGVLIREILNILFYLFFSNQFSQRNCSRLKYQTNPKNPPPSWFFSDIGQHEFEKQSERQRNGKRRYSPEIDIITWLDQISPVWHFLHNKFFNLFFQPKLFLTPVETKKKIFLRLCVI